MATKKNGPATEDQSAVVAGSQDRYVELQGERRRLEAELAEIDIQLRGAITSGDLTALEALTTRKSELPKLFIAASVAETTARQEKINAEDAANVKELHAAEAERESLQARIAKRRREFEEEMEKLTAELQQAEMRVSSATNIITALRNAGASNDVGYKQSLAKLAGV